MNISKNITSIREAKGIKQYQVAEMLGIEPPNYSRLEKRGDKLTIEQLGRIAKALGVTVIELLTDRTQSKEDNERVKELEVYLNHWKELAEERGKKNKSLEKYLKGITKILLEELERRAFLWIKGNEKEDAANVKSLESYQLNTILKVLETNELCQFYRDVIMDSPLLVYAINENLLGEEGEIIKAAVNDMFKEMLNTFEHQNTDTFIANIAKIQAKLNTIINESKLKRH